MRLVKELAERTINEELDCWFLTYGLCKYPGQPFDWNTARTALSFSAHHIERVMDGGSNVPDPGKLVPSHRGCNSADGLRAFNARRAAHKRGEEYVPENPYDDLDQEAALYALSQGLSPPLIAMSDPTSRNW